METWKRELYSRTICHYGVSKRDGAKFGSGRYPLGSGERPRAEQMTYRKEIKRMLRDENKTETKKNPNGVTITERPNSFFNRSSSKIIDSEKIHTDAENSLDPESKEKYDKLKKLGNDFYNLDEDELYKYKKMAFDYTIGPGQAENMPKSYILYSDWDQGSITAQHFYLMDKGVDPYEAASDVYNLNKKIDESYQQTAKDMIGDWEDENAISFINSSNMSSNDYQKALYRFINRSNTGYGINLYGIENSIADQKEIEEAREYMKKHRS